jgi:hypothetical protein
MKMKFSRHYAYTLLILGAVIFSVCFSGCTVSAPSKEPKQVYSEENQWGTAYYDQFDSAAFPHPDRENGYSYQGTFYPYHPHYSNSAVGIFVPEGFQPAKKIDLVFYFHGNFETIATAPAKFELYRQFTESGVNALLILPETAFNAPDNFGGKLEEAGGFTRLTEEVLAYINGSGIGGNSGLGSIVLTGHSGAHRVMAKIIGLGEYPWKIREIMLFDALFAEEETFAEWAGLLKSRLAVVYTENGRTAENTAKLIAMREQKLIKAREVKDNPETGPEKLQRKILILASPHDHYGVQFKADQFRKLLESSRVLDNR